MSKGLSADDYAYLAGLGIRPISYSAIKLLRVGVLFLVAGVCLSAIYRFWLSWQTFSVASSGCHGARTFAAIRACLIEIAHDSTRMSETEIAFHLLTGNAFLVFGPLAKGISSYLQYSRQSGLFFGELFYALVFPALTATLVTFILIAGLLKFRFSYKRRSRFGNDYEKRFRSLRWILTLSGIAVAGVLLVRFQLALGLFWYEHPLMPLQKIFSSYLSGFFALGGACIGVAVVTQFVAFVVFHWRYNELIATIRRTYEQ